ncbi:hypothetical protein Kfla_1476 [Kribbella flavida DSM 17836]|uniref:Uncharacterized protein n=1 Tax=Kribbella flavida (strain DSM 17836 / JCM 10339 / NBRC 14399) TaxID=479435 RepID=D2PLE8_KRIFD|nr:hypothetical protein [Kribbella flavida]ADB30577.1 hypothetical protein Kfla_1476 [Kribbella flavida DSM 17836]
MNLSTPPPVEELDRDYADQLRAELVKNARRGQRKGSVWAPVIAAACGIAVITTGVVVLAQPDDRPGPSAATPSTSSPSPAKVQKVPAGSSPRVSLDLGPASAADAKEAARKCLAHRGGHNGAPNSAQPADAETATVHQARWLKVLPGEHGKLRPARDRMLAQTLTTREGVWALCLDSDLYQVFDPARAGIPFEQSVSLNAAEPINGQWTIAEVPHGRSTVLFADFSFVTMPDVARVEVRIRWTGGASPWYGVPVVAGGGYVAASQPGAVHRRGQMEIDFRTFDKAGRQTFAGVEYG